MEHPPLPSVRQGTDVATSDGPIQKPHRGQTMRASRERHKLTTEEVAAMQGDERQELRLARVV
jgi:hypothetical protein